MTDALPNAVPKEPGRWRAIALAALVHAALFTLLWLGVRWQSETPVAIEAEVWAPQPREAAPRPPEQPPQSEHPPAKAAEATAAPVEDPNIVLEQIKRRKQLEQAALARLEAKDREKKDIQAKKRLETEKAEAAKKRLSEQARKETADKKRKQDAADEALRAQQRDEELHRLTSDIAGDGSGGNAAQAQGRRGDASYVDRLRAKIKSNTVFNVPENLTSNDPVEYLIELLPDGSVRQITRKKSSGIPAFDEAVQRAIEKSAPFPPDKSGAVPPSLILDHRPKDR